MIRNDYIMRMIEQLTVALANIAGLKVNHKYEEGLQRANEAFKDIFGLSAETIDSLDYKALIYLIGSNDVSGRAKCLIVAELLKERAEVYKALNKYDESLSCYLKSISIYIEMVLAEKELIQEYANKIEDIYKKINKYQIPRDSLFLLFRFFEDTGRYAKAEDTLFEILGDHSQDKTVVNEGISFYKRLKEKDEAELIKGNLPMDEVIEGLNKLENVENRVSP